MNTGGRASGGELSAGGVVSTGGANTGGVFVTGGSTSTGGFASGGAGSVPDAATLSQWNCDGLLSCFGDWDLAVLSTACPVDPTRPRGPSDCGSNEWYQCTQVKWPDGTLISVSCECTPYDAADAAVCTCAGFTVAQCTGHEKLCLCYTYTGILR